MAPRVQVGRGRVAAIVRAARVPVALNDRAVRAQEASCAPVERGLEAFLEVRYAVSLAGHSAPPFDLAEPVAPQRAAFVAGLESGCFAPERGSVGTSPPTDCAHCPNVVESTLRAARHPELDFAGQHVAPIRLDQFEARSACWGPRWVEPRRAVAWLFHPDAVQTMSCRDWSARAFEEAD